MAKSLDINCSSREVLELQPLIMGKLAELQNCDVAKVDMDLVSYSLLLFENRNSVDAIVTELNLFFDGDNCPKFVQWLWRLLAPISEKQTRAKFTHKKEAKKESKVTEKAGVRDGDKVEENANEVNVTEGRGVVKKLAEAKVNELNMAKVELTKIESEITVLAKENTLLKRDDAKLDSFSYLKKLNFIFLAKKTDHKTTPCVKINVIKPPSEKKSLKSHISEVLNFTVAENKKLESGKMVVQSRSGRSQLLSRDDNLSSQLQRGGGSPPHKLATPSLIGKRKHRGESEAPRFAIVNKKSVDKTSCEKRGDQYAKAKKPRIEISFPNHKGQSPNSPSSFANGETAVRNHSVAPASNINQMKTPFSFNSFKKLKMCQFWPKSNCSYMHPDQICQYHPNCMRGSSCQYYHLSVDGGSFASSMQMARHPTACLYGVRCTNQACSFTHPTLHKLQPIVADRSTITCRFGTSCRNGFACPFSHANGLLERPGRDARPATLTSGGEVGEACVMDDMTDRRINGRSGASAASSITSCSEMVASAPSERQLCRFDKKCQKIDCGLWHPLRDRDLRHLVEKEINK